jgi:hypothetical protein
MSCRDLKQKNIISEDLDLFFIILLLYVKISMTNLQICKHL